MEYAVFTEEMKKNYTILIPTMLTTHFSIIADIFRSYGYNAELLDNCGKGITDCGLKYVHNDTCYPAQVVIGQLIDALESGKYDKHKTALMITQTGGGCRASNYIHLLRKALKKAGYGYVPVISLNILGLEKSAFKLTLPMLVKLFYAIMLGDLLMLLRNQCMPYEQNSGESKALEQKWLLQIKSVLTSKVYIKYNTICKLYEKIIDDYKAIPLTDETKIKVGIVGEIFVKFSPLGNNELENFLISQNSEVVMDGLLAFCLYCVYNCIVDTKLYGTRRVRCFFAKLLYKFLLRKQNDLINAVSKSGVFEPPGSFEHTITLAKGYINLGAKMGEGWLLTAEMLELIEKGVKNIICTQPFGCLPNHIVGKGMMKAIRERNPNVNIVAIDYDAGASRVNQENRIKLMLSNATQIH